MPYSRYGQDGGGYRGGARGRSNADYGRGFGQDHSASMVSPWQGGPPGMGSQGTGGGGSGGGGGNLALALGSLLGSGGNPGLANLAGQLAAASAAMGGGNMGNPASGNPAFGGGGMGMSGYGGMRRDRNDRYYHRRDRSPPRARGRSHQRSRSRSPRRFMRNERDKGKKRPRDSSPAKERPEHEIYIGNYPVRFGEMDLRKLFDEHNIKVKAIRMKHDGLKVFAFAETENKEEILKAVEALDSKEINGRRLRVRSAGDKDPKGGGNEKKPAPRRELKVSDVTRHLAFAFNGFIGRQIEKQEFSEENVGKLKEVEKLLKEVYDLPEDDSLKISRDLEVIFMQNNRREIKPIEEDAETTQKEDETNEETKEEDENEVNEEEEEEDDGNWKRRKISKEEEEGKEQGEKENEEEQEQEATEEKMEDEQEEEEDGGEEDNENDEEITNENGKEEGQSDGEEKKEEEEEEENEDETGDDAELEAETVPVVPKPSPSRGSRGGRGRGAPRARRARGRKT